jgi:drug/metabolite transporter (DMT)-like permease
MVLADYYLAFPLCSALLYAFGSLFLKQALQNGAGALRSMFLGNLIMSACFMPLILLNKDPIHWEAIGWPIAMGACFFMGQALTILAIRVGDVSVQTPLMGTKVIFVPVVTLMLTREPIRPALWGAAGITAVAIFLLGQSNKVNFKAVRAAVIYSIVACVFFAGLDSLVAARADRFGRIPSMVGMMVTLSGLSFLLLPFARRPVFGFPVAARGPLIAGSVLIGFQALILNWGLSLFGKATSVNVVYSIRGLFGIVLVWWLGHHFGNRERQDAGGRLMGYRLAGALLLMLAIGLVFLR